MFRPYCHAANRWQLLALAIRHQLRPRRLRCLSQKQAANHGRRAGESTVDDCEPTFDTPWLVQEFVKGEDA